MMKAVNWVWFGTGPGPQLARAVLQPASLLFAAATSLRETLYDRGVLHSELPAIPALSVGNLSVGGTGKTPVAAWAARRVRERGARPGVVLRGYGGDEPLVHARLNPDVPVIVATARAAGAREARDRGCDVVVLDDAFQHRRVARSVDWVLISADRWTGTAALLPSGPWREPLSALRRATVAIITRKAASVAQARQIGARVAVEAPRIPCAVVSLELGDLHTVDGPATLPLESLTGAKVFLISGIGDPGALRRQLEQRGAAVRARAYPDHHAFTANEVAETARSARADEIVVCTLKDAVKIAPRWPRAAPALWYVSQRVNIEEGVDHLEGSLDALLRARSPDPDAGRPGGPYL